MFHVMRNGSFYGTNDLVDRFMSELRTLTPIGVLNQITLESNDATKTIRWEIYHQTFVIQVRVLLDSVTTSETDRPPTGVADIYTILAPFVGAAAQAQLQERGFSYWDPTGNLLLQCAAPFLLIEKRGATKNPVRGPESPKLRSLRGRAASEVIVRLLANGRAGTVRDLAREAGVGIGTVSRVIALLTQEDFFEPTGGNALWVTDPLRLAKRWAEDYSFSRTFRAKRYFSVLGTSLALERIKASGISYAVTGLAADALYARDDNRVPTLPADELWLYTDDIASIERVGDLVPDATRGNILVAESSFFEVGHEQYRPIGDVRAVWPWRAVGDLLSMPGRYGAVGEDLAKWLIARSPGPYAN
jgi:hypothetical protein